MVPRAVSMGFPQQKYAAVITVAATPTAVLAVAVIIGILHSECVVIHRVLPTYVPKRTTAPITSPVRMPQLPASFSTPIRVSAIVLIAHAIPLAMSAGRIFSPLPRDAWTLGFPRWAFITHTVL